MVRLQNNRFPGSQENKIETSTERKDAIKPSDQNGSDVPERENHLKSTDNDRKQDYLGKMYVETERLKVIVCLLWINLRNPTIKIPIDVNDMYEQLKNVVEKILVLRDKVYEPEDAKPACSGHEDVKSTSEKSTLLMDETTQECKMQNCRGKVISLKDKNSKQAKSENYRSKVDSPCSDDLDVDADLNIHSEKNTIPGSRCNYRRKLPYVHLSVNTEDSYKRNKRKINCYDYLKVDYITSCSVVDDELRNSSDDSDKTDIMDYISDVVIIHPDNDLDRRLAERYSEDLIHDVPDIRVELLEEVVLPGLNEFDMRYLFDRKYIFVLVTPRYFNSYKFRYKVKIALCLSSKERAKEGRLIPVLMDDNINIPDELKPLQSLQFYMKFSEEYKQECLPLYTSILQKLFTESK